MSIFADIMDLLILPEPGFYQEGEFGIRLENTLEVIEIPRLKSNGYKFLSFRMTTLVPFDTNLIKLDLLSTEQVRT